MAMLDPAADLEIYAYEWVPPFAQGHVRDLRPRWACEEAGIPYREHLINVMDKPGSYFGEQPWGQVPAIVDDGIHVFESGATLIHLGEKSEFLLPKGGQARATALSWLLGAFNSVEPSMMEFGNINLFAKGEEWATLRRPSLEAFLRKRLVPVEARVASEEWIAGEFSIADIAMVTILRTIEHSPLLDEHPAIGRYIERGTDRPAYAQAMADQMAAFARHPQPQMQGA